MNPFEPCLIWEIAEVTLQMQIYVLIMRLDTWNYQIDAVFEPQYDHYYMTLWLRDSNKKFMGMSQFFIKLQWSYHSLLKKF